MLIKNLTMLKTLLLILVIVTLSSTCAYSQQFQHQEKLVEFYGQQRYDELLQVDPALLNLLDNYVDHGFYVKNVSPGKYAEFTPIQYVPLADKNGDSVSISDFLLDYNSQNFNPLKYAYFPIEQVQIFKMEGVDKIIYILPYSSIIQN